MSREAHVRICEGVGVKLPRATRLSQSADNRISYRARRRYRNVASAFHLAHYSSQEICAILSSMRQFG
jgi:hypothetical protein